VLDAKLRGRSRISFHRTKQWLVSIAIDLPYKKDVEKPVGIWGNPGNMILEMVGFSTSKCKGLHRRIYTIIYII